VSLLGELAQVLDRLAGLVADGREAFDSDPRQLWSIERLWIYAGNLAEAHCRAEGIDDGVDPWSELISARNVYAHYRPSQIVPDRLWADTVEAIDRLRQAVGRPEA
jgi:hypothetical protein